MLRKVGFWIGALVLGALLGIGSALWALNNAGVFVQRHIGAWSYNALAGSEAADPYTRALVARAGLLALRASETIYFNLSEDSEGRPLDESCVYELSGGQLPTRWWSVTIYARDNYLPRNNDHAFSVDATRASQERWRARVSAVRGDAIHWISSRNAHNGFSLTLRMYQPRQAAREHPQTIPFPTLTTLSCPGAGT